MTAKPQPMAGHSEAPDDLIAELAKLMAQDAQDTPPPPKPAAPSPFTVRIPGDAANAPAPRRDEPVRIPQATQIEQPAPQETRPAEPPRPDASAAEPVDVSDTFNFRSDPAPRRETASVMTSATVSPEVPDASMPAPEPEPVERDSIADLIAAELAMDSQPAPAAPRPTPPNPPVSQAPAETSTVRPASNPNSGWAPVNVAPNLGGQDRPSAPQLRSVDLQPSPRPEASPAAQDRFKVPPVFGLGTNATSAPEAAAPQPVRVEPMPAPVEASFARAPAQSAPAPRPVSPQPDVAEDNVGLDPIDEIENLIGRAVRVDLDKPQAASPETRPSPRSLATPQLPRQSAPASRGISSADEAIIAAAHASGAEIGWVEPPEVGEPEPRKRQKRPRRVRSMGFSRAVAGPLIAVTLLLAAGFGLYWVLGLSGGDKGPAPLLTADATPVKETPVSQPEPAAADQSIVFNEINGVVPGAEEQLVSRDQADVNEVTLVATTPNVSSEGLANRKVRTVTVRPDGTIVSGDNSLAGSTILPVDRPNVPAVPGAQTASPELLANAGSGSTLPPSANAAAEPVVPTPEASAANASASDALPSAIPGETTAALPDPAAPATLEPAAPAAPIVTPGATVPAVDTAGNPLPGKTTVIPLQRPSSFAQTPVAAAEPAAPNNAIAEPESGALGQLPPPPGGQPSTTVPGATEVAALPNDAPAYVQLASQRSEEEARATAQRLVTRFGPLFGGANMEVQRVDLGSRGIFYRVRVPASSLEQATNICTNVKAAGGDCFTM